MANPKNIERGAVQQRAKYSVTQGQNTLRVGKKERDATKYEKKGRDEGGGIIFGRKNAASRVRQFMNEPL